ncbi:MAG: hypothetical protein AVDCRST_MAG65-899 [uncultured Solirubrobacteraceae bacterium]|uniref:Uncharacterized protein n=1 Tax=uncultured Solirubrobacteraceae bacterium TaxID=1162706 RepID=A0A6J4RFY7_9ACTN|nr:MAG: hypothetical protein AVDCRST_MAG65-899 [uncultured Solirubrobacteraceae bacterium]
MSAQVHDLTHPFRVELRRRRFRPALDLLPRLRQPAPSLWAADPFTGDCGGLRPELPHNSVRDEWAATARLHARHMA